MKKDSGYSPNERDKEINELKVNQNIIFFTFILETIGTKTEDLRI